MHPFDYYQQLKLLEDERERERDSANYYASLGFNCSVHNHRSGKMSIINGVVKREINFNEVYACAKCNGYNRTMYNYHINLMNTVNQRIVDNLTPMFFSTDKR